MRSIAKAPWLSIAIISISSPMAFPFIGESPSHIHPHVTSAAANGQNSVDQSQWQTIDKGSQSGVRNRLHVIIRTEAEWAALWKSHVAVHGTNPPLPVIDFEKEIVTGVFLGQKPTGGHLVEITVVEQSASGIVIGYRETSPPPDSVVTQALTQPFHIIRVEAQSTQTVVFKRLP